jgi:hypothetical protein
MSISLNQGTIVKALRIAGKVIRYARGGFDADETKELVADLLELAGLLVVDIAEDVTDETDK